MPSLINYLEKNNFTVVRSILLDFYSDQPIGSTVYKPYMNPLEICQFFDGRYLTDKYHFFDKKRCSSFMGISYSGGVRTKYFNKNGLYWFNLTKHSLIKYSDEIYLTQGIHAVNGANIADIQGVVIHTKFMSDFNERVNEEAKREEHFNDAEEYKMYDHAVRQNKLLSLKNKDSVKYRDTKQLIDLGIMKCPTKYKELFDN